MEDKPYEVLSKIISIIVASLPEEKKQLAYKELEEYINSLPPSIR